MPGPRFLHRAMPSDDWRTLYPFESHLATIDGHRLHYLDEGAGPVLLLLHGNPTWSFYWREIIKGLRGRYRLIVPDHIGCGLSDKPGRREYPYRLARRISDVVRLIELLRLERITLVAHDWGGAIGVGAAVAEPQLFSRFVLMNTSAFGGPCPWRIRVGRTPVVGQVAIQGLNLFALAALRMAVEKHERMTGQVRSGLLAPYDSWQHRVAIHEFVQDIPLSRRHPSYPALAAIEAGLSRFRQHPVCLVWGMRDWCFTPTFLDRFVEKFPGAEVHRLDDAGHYVVEDAWERIVPIMETFFETHRLPEA